MEKAYFYLLIYSACVNAGGYVSRMSQNYDPSTYRGYLKFIQDNHLENISFSDKTKEGVKKALLQINPCLDGTYLKTSLSDFIQECHHLPEEWARQIINDFVYTGAGDLLGKFRAEGDFFSLYFAPRLQQIEEALTILETKESTTSAVLFKNFLLERKKMYEEKEAEKNRQEQLMQDNQVARESELVSLIKLADADEKGAPSYREFCTKMYAARRLLKRGEFKNSRLNKVYSLTYSDLKKDWIGHQMYIDGATSFAEKMPYLPEKWADEVISSLKKRNGIVLCFHRYPTTTERIHIYEIEQATALIKEGEEMPSAELVKDFLNSQRELLVPIEFAEKERRRLKDLKDAPVVNQLVHQAEQLLK